MKTTENIQLKKLSKQAAVLQLSGELTVSYAQMIRDILLEGIQSYEQLEVTIEQAETIDITIFQLLEAARKSMQKADKQFTLNLKLTDEAQELWKKAGLNPKTITE